MDTVLRGLIIFALIFITGVTEDVSATTSVQHCRLMSQHSKQGVRYLRFHGCNQNTTQCKASVSDILDKSTELTFKSTTGNMVCIQKTYNGETFSLKVISPSQIVFEKLIQGADCMNSNASIFKRVVSPYDAGTSWQQLISQKHGLTANETYLAENWHPVSGSLFLTDERNRQNRFQIFRCQ